MNPGLTTTRAIASRQTAQYAGSIPETVQLAAPGESRAAALQYHLMHRSKYEVFASGEGACAGYGEKSTMCFIIAWATSILLHAAVRRRVPRHR